MAGGILNVLILTTAVTLISSSLYFLIEKLIVRPKLKGQARLILQVSLLFVFVLFPCYYLFRYTVESSGMFLTFISLAVIISIGRGILLYTKYSEDLLVRVKDSEITKLKELKAKAEVQSLHSRINPHFLYNSLNSIAGLAHSNPDKTEKMALSLSDLFRYSINRKDELMSCIKEEVDMVHSYLEIEQIRFGERLTFKIEVDKTLENVSIPRFILQPLVENAIKHGVSKIEGEGVISIYVMKHEENLLITVLDNGPAFPEGLVSGYGLQSLYDLLKLTYGEKAEVNWRNDPEKFIRVTIPIVL
jgi:sensor histidine kinase YesM